MTEQALLDAAIEQCRRATAWGTSATPSRSVVEPAGFSIVREYVGHGVGRALHEDRQVPNYGPPGRREALAPA